MSAEEYPVFIAYVRGTPFNYMLSLKTEDNNNIIVKETVRYFNSLMYEEAKVPKTKEFTLDEYNNFIDKIKNNIEVEPNKKISGKFYNVVLNKLDQPIKDNYEKDFKYIFDILNTLKRTHINEEVQNYQPIGKFKKDIFIKDNSTDKGFNLSLSVSNKYYYIYVVNSQSKKSILLKYKKSNYIRNEFYNLCHDCEHNRALTDLELDAYCIIKNLIGFKLRPTFDSDSITYLSL